MTKLLCESCKRELAYLAYGQIYMGPKVCVDCRPEDTENIVNIKGRIVDADVWDNGPRINEGEHEE